MAAKCKLCTDNWYRMGQYAEPTLGPRPVNNACCYILHGRTGVTPCCSDCKNQLVQDLIIFAGAKPPLKDIYSGKIFKRKQDAELQLITNKLLGE